MSIRRAIDWALVLVLGPVVFAQARDRQGIRVLRNLEYVRGGGPAHSLDLYLPERTSGRLPVIVWVHGGAWSGGSKEWCPAVSLAARGYAVASINYRLSGQAKFPAQIEDCKAAVRWLRANAGTYHLDPDRIGAWGDSAGGHLVALLGTSGGVKALEGGGGNLGYSSRVQAVCDWFGPTDFLHWGDRARPPADRRSPHGHARNPIVALLGGSPEELKEKAIQASPITYVSPDDPPFLIMHGDRDNLVPLQQSERLRDALKKAGVEVTLHVVKGAGHGFGGPEVRAMVQAFFDRHLKGARTAEPSAPGKAGTPSPARS